MLPDEFKDIIHKMYFFYFVNTLINGDLSLKTIPYFEYDIIILAQIVHRFCKYIIFKKTHSYTKEVFLFLTQISLKQRKPSE